MGRGKRRERSPRALIFPLPSLRASRVYFFPRRDCGRPLRRRESGYWLSKSSQGAIVTRMVFSLTVLKWISLLKLSGIRPIHFIFETVISIVCCVSCRWSNSNQTLFKTSCSLDRKLKKKLEILTGRRHGDRRFIKWTRFLVKASWLNIRRKCCKACGTGTQERYCLI